MALIEQRRQRAALNLARKPQPAGEVSHPPPGALIDQPRPVAAIARRVL